MEIKSVKIQGNGYLLNGNMSVPKADGNREYELIKEWLAKGNTPEAEFTEEELAAKALVAFKAEVKSALDATTTTALRCYQAGIAFPTEWKTYIDALRGLLSATTVTTLPTRPDYPAES